MSIYLGFFKPRLLFLNGLKRGLKLKISKPKNVFRFKNIIFFDDTPHFLTLEVEILQCVRSWRLWVRQCLICLYGRTATVSAPNFTSLAQRFLKVNVPTQMHSARA